MASKSLVPGLVIGAVVVLIGMSCSSATPSASQSPIEVVPHSSTPPVSIPERYALQQTLDFTMTLTTTSTGGRHGRLDRKHTCERGDMSPDLRWEGIPETAKSLALIMDDPASDMMGWEIDILWNHWVVYSIPSNITGLESDQKTGNFLDSGAKQGVNDYGRVQYNGPCPIPNLKFSDTRTFPSGAPGGGARRQPRENISAEDRSYYLRIYALDIPVTLDSGVDRDTFLKTIDGNVLAAGELRVPYKSTKSFTCRTLDETVCLENLPNAKQRQ